jgi:cytochrome c553
MDESREGRAWSLVSIAAVGGLLLVAFAFGFVVVPVVQGREAGIDPWTAFCRALGILPGTAAMAQPVSTATARPVSRVAWTPEVLAGLVEADRKAGEQLAAQVCAACHGPRGLSPSPQFPHLSGQSAAAIYKQLHDYKSGARANPLMAGIAQGLTEAQMLAVAAHYAGGNSFKSLGNVRPAADYETDRLANRGAPNRGVPACNGCHAGGVGGPIETPTLAGQQSEYLQAQLRLYASGERGNDVYGRMRTIASRLTREEIRTIAEHYAGMPATER